MTFNYERSRKIADRLIGRFGAAAKIRRTTLGDGSTGDPWNPAGFTPERENSDIDCTLVEIQYTSREIDGTLIKQGDKRFYISTIHGGADLSITPGVEDFVVWNNEVYAIISVDTLSPAGSAVYYDIQARKT